MVPLPDISVRLTAAVRAADSRFETVGGSSRHYVNDCLLPALEAGRLSVVDVLVPQHLKSAERNVDSLSTKLDLEEKRVAALSAERILLGACVTKLEKQRDNPFDALRALLTECEGAASNFEDRIRIMGDARAALSNARSDR